MLMPCHLPADAAAADGRKALPGVAFLGGNLLRLLAVPVMLMLAGPAANAQDGAPAAVVDAAVDPLIAEVQRQLATQGYDPGPADGNPSARSRDAVRAYQRDAGLAETGLFTEALLERLRGATAARPADAPQPPPLKFSNDIATPPPPSEVAKAPPQPRPKPALPKPVEPARPPSPPPAATPPPPRPEAATEEKARERGAREGMLEIFLAWGSTSDIDLHVRCPTGGNIWFRNMEDCGGKLDLDTNALGTLKVSDPVEHVVFPAPPEGRYRVEIANCELMGPPEGFRLWVVYKGKTIAQTSNEIPVDPGWNWPCGGPQSYLTFQIPE